MGSGGLVPVDGKVLENGLKQLARFGGSNSLGRGVTRLAWSDEFGAAQRWLLDEMASLGLRTFIDRVGNTWGLWEVGDTPALVIGSHIDSVPNGGMYDGCLGVLAGLAAVRSLMASGVIPRRQIWIVAWAEEEGSATGNALLGSRLFTGVLDPGSIGSRAEAGSGQSQSKFDVQDVLEKQASSSTLSQPDMSGLREGVGSYLELHIEQGPILESSRVPIGIVERIVGVVCLNVTVEGEGNHAGGTPMAIRRDALVASSILIQAVDRLAREYDLRATVGSLRVSPGASNVIPKVCHFTLDARAADQARLHTFLARFGEECAAVRATQRVGVAYEEVYELEPVSLNIDLRAALASEAAAAGLSTLEIVSGAAHDAMALARSVPSAMLFVPSRRGISHAPDEFTEAEFCADGASVLARTVARFVE